MWSRVSRFFGPENDCAGEDQQQFVNYRPIFLSGRMLHKDYENKYSVGKNITGRDPQRAYRQDELVSGKAPVVK
jgi:hypothetical protein